MLTKDSIKKMKEDQLCKEVLKPLLEAMKFRDVTVTHGVNEKGKDIVCWTTDEFGLRENHAFVVKAKAINGKAQPGSGNAGEVLIQIQQVFGSSYADPVSTLMQSVDKCWVITNQEILSSATEAIQAALGATNASRNVRFVDGDKLWKLIEQYLVQQAVHQKLHELQSAFSQWDSHYIPNVSISGSEIRLALQEKYPGAAKEKPISFDATFSFPNTDEGKRVRADFEKMLSKGDSVILPEGFFRIENIPDVLKSLIGSDTITSGTLVIGSVSDHHFKAKVEVMSDDGLSETLDYLDLKVMKLGRDEATLENVAHGSPFNLRVVITPAKHSLTFHMRWDYFGKTVNPAQLYKQLNLQRCLSKPFMLKFSGLEDQSVVIEQKGNAICPPPPEPFMNMVKDIAQIQLKLKTILMLPIREYDESDVETIDTIRNIFQEGRRKARWNTINMILENVDETSFEKLATHPGLLKVEREETYDFFGNQIPLGMVSYILHDAIIKDWEKVKQQIENADKKSIIEVQFIAKDGEGDLEVTYLNWVDSAK